jgi:hypothetical protein
MVVKLETLLIYPHKLRFAKLARAGDLDFILLRLVRVTTILQIILFSKKIMFKSIVILFIISIVLFFIGYNFVFNTVKIISKYITLSEFKEGSYFYKQLSSEANIAWMKIVGYGMLMFSIITFVSMIVLILKNYVSP